MQLPCIVIPCHPPTNQCTVTTPQPDSNTQSHQLTLSNLQAASALQSTPHSFMAFFIRMVWNNPQPPVSAPPCPCCCATKVVDPSQ